MARPFRQVEGEVTIVNNSAYAAQNPGVRITLLGLGGIPEQPGWTVIRTENVIGIMQLQWDGGADYIIHGRWLGVTVADRGAIKAEIKRLFADGVLLMQREIVANSPEESRTQGILPRRMARCERDSAQS